MLNSCCCSCCCCYCCYFLLLFRSFLFNARMFLFFFHRCMVKLAIALQLSRAKLKMKDYEESDNVTFVETLEVTRVTYATEISFSLSLFRYIHTPCISIEKYFSYASRSQPNNVGVFKVKHEPYNESKATGNYFLAIFSQLSELRYQ